MDDFMAIDLTGDHSRGAGAGAGAGAGSNAGTARASSNAPDFADDDGFGDHSIVRLGS